MAGKIYAATLIADIQNQCSKWDTTNSVSGVSSGKSLTASSMQSVYDTVYGIMESDAFSYYVGQLAGGPTAPDKRTVSRGGKAYQSDEDFIIGEYMYDDKIGVVYNGLLTYIASQCRHCNCDGVCNEHVPCTCDGSTHICACDACNTGGVLCDCDTYCNGYGCIAGGYQYPCDDHSCPCDTTNVRPCDRNDGSCYSHCTSNCDTDSCVCDAVCDGCNATCYSHKPTQC